MAEFLAEIGCECCLHWERKKLGRDASRDHRAMTTIATAKLADQSSRWRAIAAASVGNAFEWYDFVIYGYFATTIAKLFFPSKKRDANL
jgi:hypothetical protein